MSGTPRDLSNEEWHAARARHIGGSECAALFGQAPAYALSHYALWHVKAGLAPPPEVGNERTDWGLRLEAAIAEGAAAQESWTIRKGGYVTDPTTPGLGCTLDYWITQPGPNDTGCAGPGLLEIKNADWLQHKRTWTDGEPPPHVLLQLQHQAACTGYTWGAVAALIGGNHLEIYRYAARPKLIAEIRRRVTAFWASIDEGRPPPVDETDGATVILKAMYPELHDEELDLEDNNEFPEACAHLLQWADARKLAAKEEDFAKNRIRALLGDCRRARGGGYRVSVAVTPAKEPRPPRDGEMIAGRAEARRITVKELAS